MTFETDTKWAVRCVRIKKDGTPCRKYAIPGGTVCDKHGGNAPQVRAAADRRLEAFRATIVHSLAPLALQRVYDALQSEDPKIALRAALDILDRAGLAPERHTSTTHTVKISSDLDDSIHHLIDASKRSVIDVPSHPSDPRPSLPPLAPGLGTPPPPPPPHADDAATG